MHILPRKIYAERATEDTRANAHWREAIRESCLFCKPMTGANISQRCDICGKHVSQPGNLTASLSHRQAHQETPETVV